MFLLGKAKREPRLTRKRLKRCLLRNGWTVGKAYTYNIDAFAQIGHGKVYAFLVSIGEPLATIIVDSKKTSMRFNCMYVIVTNAACSQATLELAADCGTLILRWPDISNIEERTEALYLQRKTALATAKLSPLSASFTPLAAQSVVLTTSQELLGFVFASKEISCWFVDRGGDRLMLTFAPNPSSAEDPKRWGARFGDAAGVSTLGFEPASYNWYPEEYMAAAIDALRVILQRFSKRTCLGIGQGGFAALRYSSAFNAELVVAVSPQFTIDPSVFTDSRFVRFYKSAWHSGMQVKLSDTSGKLVIAYDSYSEPDTMHAHAIGNRLPVTKMILPFSGFGCPSVFSSPLIVQELLLQWDTKADMVAQCIARGQRHKDTRRPELMALHLCQTKPAVAFRIFEQYRNTRRVRAWGHVCYRLAHVGFAERMLGWILSAVAESPSDPDVLVLAAVVSLEASKIDAAFDFVQRALAISPEDGRLLHLERRIVAARSRQAVS